MHRIPYNILHEFSIILSISKQARKNLRINMKKKRSSIGIVVAVIRAWRDPSISNISKWSSPFFVNSRKGKYGMLDKKCITFIKKNVLPHIVFWWHSQDVRKMIHAHQKNGEKNRKTTETVKLLRTSHIGSSSMGRVVNSVIQVESHWELATRTRNERIYDAFWRGFLSYHFSMDTLSPPAISLASWGYR